MRLILIFVLALGLALPLAAQDVDYNAMTIAELEAIDLELLSKKEEKKIKKALKKKYKAQKKAEKARIKAERKAAKARKKRHGTYFKIYEKIEIEKSDFDNHTTIRGPVRGRNVSLADIFGGGDSGIIRQDDDLDWSLRSFVAPDGAEVTQLVAEISYAGPRRARYRNYRSASFRGGLSAEINQLDSGIVQCGDSNCRYQEDVGVVIPADMLRVAFAEGRRIDVQISAQSGNKYIATVTAEYIQAYVRKMGEVTGNIPKEVIAARIAALDETENR